MVTTITGTTNKPVSSDRLKNYFSAHNEFDGILYIGYPIIGTVEGAYPIDALWISPKQGLVVFNLIEGKRLGDYQDDQDDSYNKVESSLKVIVNWYISDSCRFQLMLLHLPRPL